jgi:membrane protein implicated in regulation of membrane protease activity
MEVENLRVVLLMYLLRAVSIVLILTLLVYITYRQFYMLDLSLRFHDFVFENILVLFLAVLFTFFVQLLFYEYQKRTKGVTKRSRGETIIGYVLSIVGIITAVYAAYAMGFM